MILKAKHIYILILISSFLLSNELKDDIFYNYYILNGSPASSGFNDVLKNDYEYNLIHRLEIDGITSGSSNNYENFLETYCNQYKKDNIRFINAIVEPDIFYLSGRIGTTNIISEDARKSIVKSVNSDRYTPSLSCISIPLISIFPFDRTKYACRLLLNS